MRIFDTTQEQGGEACACMQETSDTALDFVLSNEVLIAQNADSEKTRALRDYVVQLLSP